MCRLFWIALCVIIWGSDAGPGELTVALPTDIFDAAHHMGEILNYITLFDSLRTRDMHCLDFFGGRGMMSTTWGRHGFTSAKFDKQTTGSQDLLSKEGFFIALEFSLRLVPGGFVPSGPPCSLFIFLSSSYHRRSVKQPRGDETKEKVRLANIIVSNACIILLIGIVRGVKYFIEQPHSSKMFLLPIVKALLKGSAAQRVFTWMGKFEHPLPKTFSFVVELDWDSNFTS